MLADRENEVITMKIYTVIEALPTGKRRVIKPRVVHVIARSLEQLAEMLKKDDKRRVDAVFTESEIKIAEERALKVRSIQKKR